jgi:hypothetical protein
VSRSNGKGGVYGPIIMPARIYPSTIGCFSLCVNRSIRAATIMITAKSCTIVSEPNDCEPLVEKIGGYREIAVELWFTVDVYRLLA